METLSNRQIWTFRLENMLREGSAHVTENSYAHKINY